jgi:hypothetical protein
LQPNVHWMKYMDYLGVKKSMTRIYKQSGYQFYMSRQTHI